ncbi:exodeoxyribonuclease VII large subunit [Agromyces protaetiae]|uniref:Exodeoxyribonuclease 7 large subunit n=2 Tax=Agromyces protaetiae TaxID=2509455 RepID=A0A4P6FJZ9_9MICO|nr:exodeoxyribonuclease VII large subunit [Agromyces protaetiae]QAY74949.1 exodeoxyribonuclease VII large subunit [Agromyces protaetiae]
MLSNKLKEYLDRLGTVWVEGEITQWGISAGNVYGKLKDVDADATVSFTIWSSVKARLSEQFTQGDRVVALVKPNWWVKGGSLTMQVFDLKHVGVGDLLERIEQLRAKLQAEGLFDPARKKRLPFLPGVIGLVTGRDSDAEKDVLRNAHLRWPAVEFRIEYAAVQGDRTVPEVVRAIAKLDADPEVEVIIVARGGGDFQNLLGFSDERVVRAAAEASTPIVSAIGHEADRPLLDEVADLRASTPTDAAKRVVPDVADELARVEQTRARLGMRLTAILTREIDRIEHLRSRPSLADSNWIVDRRAEELTRWVARGTELVERTLERQASRVGELRGHLRALSPQATLDRGYAIVQGADGHVVRSSDAAPAGASLVVTLAEGALAAVSEGATGDVRTGASTVTSTGANTGTSTGASTPNPSESTPAEPVGGRE